MKSSVLPYVYATLMNWTTLNFSELTNHHKYNVKIFIQIHGDFFTIIQFYQPTAELDITVWV